MIVNALIKARVTDSDLLLDIARVVEVPPRARVHVHCACAHVFLCLCVSM